MSRQVVDPGGLVPVRLTPAQRDLILEQVFIDTDVAERLRTAEVDGASVIVRLSLDDLEDLLGAVAAEANHTTSASLETRLDAIYARLRDVEETHTDDPSDSPTVSFVPRYTAKQGQYLAFIHYYTKIHGEAPAEADLRRYFQVSPPSVHRMIVTLEERGLIERTPGRARSIRLLVDRSEIPDLE